MATIAQYLDELTQTHIVDEGLIETMTNLGRRCDLELQANRIYTMSVHTSLHTSIHMSTHMSTQGRMLESHCCRTREIC